MNVNHDQYNRSLFSLRIVSGLKSGRATEVEGQTDTGMVALPACTAEGQVRHRMAQLEVYYRTGKGGYRVVWDVRKKAAWVFPVY